MLWAKVEYEELYLCSLLKQPKKEKKKTTTKYMQWFAKPGQETTKDSDP